MRVQHGMNANLSLVGLEPMQCDQLQGTNSQGTLTLTARKRDCKNKQAQLWFNPQRPRVIGRCTHEFPHASGHSTCCCWACRSVCFLTCTGIPCRDSHCENGLVRCCLYRMICKNGILNRRKLEIQLFSSMFYDIDWTRRGNEEICLSNSQKGKMYAKRFLQGHWTFLGPGDEEKGYGILR